MNLKKASTVGMCSISVVMALVLTLYGSELRTSESGLAIIGNAEQCRTIPYYCPASVLTVGVGSTRGVIKGKTYTKEEIARRWAHDIKEAETCVNKWGNGERLPQSVFDATVSITFNVGCTQMQKSTLYRLLRQNKLTDACNQFGLWVYAGGKRLNGLVIRRDKERSLCLSEL